MSEIKKAIGNIKVEENIQIPAFLSEVKRAKMLKEHLSGAARKANEIKASLLKAADYAPRHDNVYRALQRLFKSDTPLNLKRDNPIKNRIYRKALKRYLYGCPPRKLNEIHLGDAFNWEWMVECCASMSANLFVVSRDSDYGTNVGRGAGGEQIQINDFLAHEFQERVGLRKK